MSADRKLPKVKGTSITESKGLNLINRTVTNEMGWLFREQPTDDYGIDAHLEIVEGEKATGRLIGLQVKAGASYLAEENARGFVYRGKVEHLNYWTNSTLPVVLVLCDVARETCYWVHVTEEAVERTSDDGWKVLVPKDQVLDSNSKYDLLSIAENLSEYEKRFQSLLLARGFMRALEAGDTVFLEAGEWVNKTWSREYINISVEDSRTSQEKVRVEWADVFIKGVPFKQRFARLFPWANLSVDEEFYDEYERDDHLASEAFYDSEDDVYIITGIDYTSWRRQLPDVRPYHIDAGEIARYRLKAEMNEIGRAFLILDKYLTG